MAGHGGSTKVVVAALVGNLGIAVAKFTAWGFTRSSAMLAESFHSLADSGNQLLMLLGLKRAEREPDETHPYGYGKETYFWSFVVAMSIFTLGSAFAIYEGVHSLMSILAGAAHVQNQTIGLAVLGVSIVLEGYSFSVALREFNRTRGDGSVAQVLKETRSAELVTVLFEDAAALAGLVVALVGISLTALTGNPIFDALASIIIGVLLAFVAFFLAAMTKRLLIGQSASARVEALIREQIIGVAGVVAIKELKTLHMGASFILLNIGVKFADSLDTRRLESVIDSIEERVKQAVPEVKRIFIEADSLRADA